MYRFRALLWLPILGCATANPYVTKGPVITGVTQHEAWVTWETAQPRGATCPSPTRTGLRLAGGAAAPVEDAVCAKAHHIRLTDLAPGTAYSFALLDPGPDAASGGGRFATAPAAAEGAFKFVVYGDNRDSSFVEPPTRANHEAVATAILQREADAAFLLQTGDLALNMPGVAGPDRGYREFFDIERALLASRPLFAAVGNHEKLDLQEFDTLVNAPSFSGAAHPYYSAFDWGGVHLVLLDSFDRGGSSGFSEAQLAWLDTDLSKARGDGQLIFVVAHRGPYSHCRNSMHCHGGMPPPDRDRLVQLLLKYQVAAVFAGHDHYYERGQEGCINYLVVGGGGAPLYQPDEAAAGVKAAKMINSYVVVTINGHTATMVAKDTAGNEIDRATLAPLAPAECGKP